MLNAHPVHHEFGPGPMEALDTFLSEADDFIIDAIGAKSLVSVGTRGYLRRA
jgi:cephalosporin hydroxylase